MERKFGRSWDEKNNQSYSNKPQININPKRKTPNNKKVDNDNEGEYVDYTEIK